MYVRYFVFFFLPLGIYSQNIKGKVYDHQSTVKGIKVYNISTKTKTYTDDKGEFSIAAAVGDTLFFESLFHLPKHQKLREIDFTDIAVFELKKMVNELGEVLISNEKAKAFNVKAYTSATGSQLGNDMKNNPHLYMPKSSYSNGINFVALAKMIGKLFKKKNKPKPIEFIEYKDLDSLFRKDKLFNLKLLNQDLNISEEYTHLFLDYCETKSLNKALLSEKNKVILLDSLVEYSRDFLKITQEYEASKATLDLKN